MFVDFTHVIDNGITSYTEETKPVINIIASINIDLYEERSINIYTHTGTHIDSPAHMINGGKYIDDYILEDFCGNAVILDLSKRFVGSENDEGDCFVSESTVFNINEASSMSDDKTSDICRNNYESIDGASDLIGSNINLEDLYEYSEEIGKADFVLIKTGFVKYWCTEKYVRDYPSLTVEAANYLAGFKLKGIGIDCISIGNHEDEITNHKIFLDRNILIIENLNLEKIINGVFKVVIAPLKVKNSDGAPVRIFGIS